MNSRLAVTDTPGGQVQLLIDAPQVTMQYVKAGKLKAIAVSGKTRLATLPDVPTFDEAGATGVDASGWQGIAVPAGPPREAIDKLSEALAWTIALPEVREKLATQGLDAASSTADEFSAHIRKEVLKCKALPRPRTSRWTSDWTLPRFAGTRAATTAITQRRT